MADLDAGGSLQTFNAASVADTLYIFGLDINDALWWYQQGSGWQYYGSPAVAASFVTAAPFSAALGIRPIPGYRPGRDFDADGDPQLVWQDPLSGTSQIWFLRGTAITDSAVLSGPNAWRIAALGHFSVCDLPPNCPAAVDVVWQDPNSGASQIRFTDYYGEGGGPLPLSGPNPWRIVTAGDFDGDSYPDVVWQDPASGASQIWFLYGTTPGPTTVKGSAALSGPNAWRIVGAADFNGDGKLDVLWQDPVTGAAQVWYLNGAQGNTVIDSAPLCGPNSWRIVAILDFNGDGHPDVVWQDPVSGASQVWLLTGAQGTTLIGAPVSLSGPNPWRIVEPR